MSGRIRQHSRRILSNETKMDMKLEKVALPALKGSNALSAYVATEATCNAVLVSRLSYGSYILNDS